MISKRICTALAASLAFCAGAASAEPKPVSDANANGTVSGTIDGNEFELPVSCVSISGIGLMINSHDQPISNNKSIGGVEPALGIMAPETGGFQFTGFMGGKRYKFLRARDSIETFPFTLARTVRVREHGKVEVDLTLDCPNS